MSHDEVLSVITHYVDRAHGEQLRKYSSDRYVVHPVRVMQTCALYTKDIHVLAAALLHDVLEDTSITKEAMDVFLTPLLGSVNAQRTLSLVIELTDIYTRTNYPRLNRKQRKALEAKRLSECSSDAQTIKYADVMDNSHNIIQHDPGFGPIFLKEAYDLLTVLRKGNALLYEKALEILRYDMQVKRNEKDDN